MQVSNTMESFTVPDLEADTAYTIRIAAVNKYGTGDFAEIPEVSTSSKFTKPTVKEAPILTEITEEVTGFLENLDTVLSVVSDWFFTAKLIQTEKGLCVI